MGASHGYHLMTLARIHADSFDRVLVAQCMIEHYPILTRARMLAQSGMQILQG